MLERSGLGTEREMILSILADSLLCCPYLLPAASVQLTCTGPPMLTHSSHPHLILILPKADTLLAGRFSSCCPLWPNAVPQYCHLTGHLIQVADKMSL